MRVALTIMSIVLAASAAWSSDPPLERIPLAACPDPPAYAPAPEWRIVPVRIAGAGPEAQESVVLPVPALIYVGPAIQQLLDYLEGLQACAEARGQAIEAENRRRGPAGAIDRPAIEPRASTPSAR